MQINHNQSRTRPWSKDHPDEKLLRLTHCALEPWHELIDPVMGESGRSFLGYCHRVIACSFSDQTRGVDARITRPRWNGCQVVRTLWNLVRGERGPKTWPQTPGECYDVIGGLGCFQTSKSHPKCAGFFLDWEHYRRWNHKCKVIPAFMCSNSMKTNSKWLLIRNNSCKTATDYRQS